MIPTQYRELKKGELINNGDEFKNEHGWDKCRACIGCACSRNDDIRRPIQIPALKEGWLFYGKGPLLHPSTPSKDIAAYNEEWGTYQWNYDCWEGKLDSLYFAIRAGSELARLNGLEPMQAEWRPKNLPAELPDPPAPPEGTRWVYRGEHWKSDSTVNTYYYCDKWHGINHSSTSGYKDFFYLEAVTLEPKLEVWTFATKDWPAINGLRQQVKDLNTVVFDQAAKITELEACLVKTEKWSDIYAAERTAFQDRLNAANSILKSIADITNQREF